MQVCLKCKTENLGRGDSSVLAERNGLELIHSGDACITCVLCI